MTKKLNDAIEKKLSELRGKKGSVEDNRQELVDGLELVDGDERQVIEEEIERLDSVLGGINAEIESILSDRRKLREAKQSSDEYKWEQVRPKILASAQELNMSYNVETGKFIYCMDMSNGQGDSINPVFRSFEANKVEGVMSKELGRWLPDANYEIKRLFVQEGLTHNQETASFFDNKWSKHRVYNKAHIIRKFWVDPICDQGYNPDFDILLYCVGGGKQENIEHLEQWLAYKYLYPERVVNTPNLDIGGNPGGNGKGIYANLAKTIFTGECVKPAVAKELNDGFNASWELAVILHFDEPEEKELPASKMKNATGGTEQRVERKGVDAYSSDRIHSILATSNNTLGVFKLAGTGTAGEDRRYSVISTNIPLADEIASREGISVEQAKVRASEIAELVKNRTEVGRWLGSMLIKHNVQNMQQLNALHKQDYLARFADQKSSVDEVMDSLMPIIIQSGTIGVGTLTDILAAKIEMQKKPSSKTTMKWVTEWCARRRQSFSKIEQCRFKITYKGRTNESKNQTVLNFTNLLAPDCSIDWELLSEQPYNPLNLKPESFKF
jgi:hypothetical protein